MPDCSSVQKSLAWCQGRPELPGVKRRIYYISKYDVLQWPKLPHDANGRLTSAAYTGDFVLRADAKWKFIDIISDKSQLTSDAQGEYPSQTQLNKLVAVHPGVDEDASAAAAYLNNNDNVFLVEDMRGAVRVVGSDKWPTKTTVTQDLGQGATGSTSTTINVEATDECPAPFYAGKIATEDGEINPEGNPNQATVGENTGSGQNSSSGNSSSSSSNSSSSSLKPTYNSTVVINGQSYSISKGDTINVSGNITSMKFTGSNMSFLSYDGENGISTEIEINSDGTSATCTDKITAPGTVKIYRKEGTGNDAQKVLWFTINLTSSSSSGSTSGGSTGGNTNGGNTSIGGNTPSGQSSYDEVFINGYLTDVSSGSVNIIGPLYALFVKGVNMDRVAIQSEGAEKDTDIPMSENKTLAGSGNLRIFGPTSIKVFRSGLSGVWFTINITSGNSVISNSIVSAGTRYYNSIEVNGEDYDVREKKMIYVTAPLTSVSLPGVDMLGVCMYANSKSYMLSLDSNNKKASWSGSIDESVSLNVKYKDATGTEQDWFTISVSK